MTVRANLDGDGFSETILFTLAEKDQSQAITLEAIAKLEVSCTGAGNQKCIGKFCIEIDYEKDCSLEEPGLY
jgi:hypothetical protein